VRRLGALAALAVAAALAPGAALAGPPPAGVLVAGRSLGGVRLGMTAAQVEAAWGLRHGLCRSCAARTWYFNLVPFQPGGAGVELRRGRVDAVFTIWAPHAWHDARGLRMGDAAADVTGAYGPLRRAGCGDYAALTLVSRGAVTAFYLVGEKLWGFGLLSPGSRVCR